MELPGKEEDKEEVMSVPEPLKVGATTFLPGKPNHDAQTSGHDPASSTGTSGKVCLQENEDTLTSSLCIRVKHGEFLEVAHVSGNMDNREYDHGPRSCFVEGDVFVKGNELIQWCPAKE